MSVLKPAPARDIDHNENGIERQLQVGSRSIPKDESKAALNVTVKTVRQACSVIKPMAGVQCGLAYSPEDTLNNDYFYDDEFTVPFDANLCESKAEGNEICSSTDFADPEFAEVLQRMGNFAKARRSSNVTHGLADSAVSDEVVISENEQLTSSELSDYHPLFSPPPTPATEFSQSISNENPVELTSSYQNEDNSRYDFDWKSTVNQYIISFDQNKCQVSTDTSSSLDDSTHAEGKRSKVLTTWAGVRKSVWSSKSSDSEYDNIQQSATPTPPSLSSDCNRSKSSSLTTWQAVKSPSLDNDSGHRISWTVSEPTATAPYSLPMGDKKKSASLPNMPFKHQSIAYDNGSGSITIDAKDLVKKEPVVVGFGGNLLDLYQQGQGRTRRGTGSPNNNNTLQPLQDSCDVQPLSPTALRRLTGTWSMSTMSSGKQSLEGSLHTPENPVKELCTWLTEQNLAEMISDSTVQSGCTSDKRRSRAQGQTRAVQAGQEGEVQLCSVGTQFPGARVDAKLQTSFSLQSSDGTNEQYPVSALSHSKSTPQFTYPQSPIRGLDCSPTRARGRLLYQMMHHNPKLPDLGFLKDSCSKVIPEMRHHFRRHNSVRTKSAACQTDDLIPLFPPPKPPRRSVSISPYSSRDVSPNPNTLAHTLLLRKRSNSASSMCSSSSSGIDPGHMSTESQKNQASSQSSCDAVKCYSVVYSDGSPSAANCSDVHLCGGCLRQLQAVTKNSLVICVESSHTHCATDVASSQADTYGGVPKPANKDVVRVAGLIPPRLVDSTDSSSVEVVSDDALGKPLKSCLRRKTRNRNEVALKHRSWSDPYDATVLHYSQNGEARYQLLTQPSGHHCWVKLSSTPALAPVQDESAVLSSRVAAAALTDVQAAPASPIEAGPSDAGSQRSLERIAMPACSTGTVHAVLHSSSDSGEDGSDLKKKSVSFSERVFYHSPTQSPRRSASEGARLVEQSPSPGDRLVLESVKVGESAGTRAAIPPLSLPPTGTDEINEWLTSGGKECNYIDTELLQSGSSGYSSVGTFTELEQRLQTQKLNLIEAVENAIVKIVHHCTLDPDQQMWRTSTLCNPAVGNMVLDDLCPAIVALVTDGLHPNVRSLFGKVKNSPWRIAQQSVGKGAISKGIYTLVKDLEGLELLSTTMLKFNAFIFGLLNHRSLDFWMAYICNHDSLTLTDYTPTAFLSLSQTLLRPLFLRLNASLQSLTKIPFRLEYTFEYKRQKAKEQELYAQFLLQKHTGTSRSDQRLQQVLLRNGGLNRHLSVDEALEILNTSSSSSEQLTHSWRPETTGETLVNTRKLLFATSSSIKDTFRQMQRRTKVEERGTGPVRGWHPAAHGQQPRGFWGDVMSSLRSLTSSQDSEGAVAMEPVTVRYSGSADSSRTSMDLMTIEEYGDVCGDISINAECTDQPRSPEDDVVQAGGAFGTQVTATPVEELIVEESPAWTDDAASLRTSSSSSVGGSSLRKQPSQATNSPMSGKVESATSQTATGSVTLASQAPAAPQAGSLSRTAAFFRKKLGPSLIGVFDRFLVDKTGKKDKLESSDVKRSASAMELPKKYGQTLCHHVATDNQQLSFEKGSLLLLIKEVDTEWLMCRRGDQIGVVHKACIQVLESP